MRPGERVTLAIDAYPERTIHGHVDSVQPGSGTAFSLLPAQNATGNWIKVVQRLPVRIRLNPDELTTHPLRVGLSMDAKVDLRSDSQQLASASAATDSNS